MIALGSVSTNNFVTCRRTVQKNVVRPSVEIVSCETGYKADGTFAITTYRVGLTQKKEKHEFAFILYAAIVYEFSFLNDYHYLNLNFIHKIETIFNQLF